MGFRHFTFRPGGRSTLKEVPGTGPAAKVKEDAMQVDPVTLITSGAFVVAAMWTVLVMLLEYRSVA